MEKKERKSYNKVKKISHRIGEYESNLIKQAVELEEKIRELEEQRKSIRSKLFDICMDYKGYIFNDDYVVEIKDGKTYRSITKEKADEFFDDYPKLYFKYISEKYSSPYITICRKKKLE